jgi:hypothetical protein
MTLGGLLSFLRYTVLVVGAVDLFYVAQVTSDFALATLQMALFYDNQQSYCSSRILTDIYLSLFNYFLFQLF